MAKQKKKYLLRLDADIHNSMARWADDELRSFNAQIEFVLREALRKSGRLKKRRQRV